MIKIMITLWLMMVCLTINIYGRGIPAVTGVPMIPHCVYNGESLEVGHTFQPDPCTWCICDTVVMDDEVMCFPFGCDDDPGTPTTPTTPYIPIACEYEGQYYLVGDFKPSPCKQCTCTDTGLAYCAIIDCEPPPCLNPVQSEDKCCPTCPEDIGELKASHKPYGDSRKGSN